MKIHWKVTIERKVKIEPSIDPYTGELPPVGFGFAQTQYYQETKEMSKEIKDVSEFDDFKSRAPSNCYEFRLEL